MLTEQNFKNVAKNRSNIGWSDQELAENIDVLKCLVAYFSERGEPMITFSLRIELEAMEGYAFQRSLHK